MQHKHSIQQGVNFYVLTRKRKAVAHPKNWSGRVPRCSFAPTFHGGAFIPPTVPERRQMMRKSAHIHDGAKGTTSTGGIRRVPLPQNVLDKNHESNFGKIITHK